MTDIIVIVNPAARGTKAGRAWEKIEILAKGSATIIPTTKAGEARQIAAAAAKSGTRIVVAAGGDGTINEVVNGIAGTEAALGILPVGTMNVFAAELGLPTDLREAWKILLLGKTRTIDLARANRRYFVQLAGAGLDAQVVQETSRAMKRSLGPLSYLISTAQIAARQPPRILVTRDEETIECSFVLIGNGRYYGGPLAFFQNARVDDGKLDVLLFKKTSHLDLARYFAHIVMGRHTTLPDVEYFQTTKILVQSDDKVPVEVDGEMAGELPVTFRISSKKLKVVAP